MTTTLESTWVVTEAERKQVVHDGTRLMLRQPRVRLFFWGFPVALVLYITLTERPSSGVEWVVLGLIALLVLGIISWLLPISTRWQVRRLYAVNYPIGLTARARLTDTGLELNTATGSGTTNREHLRDIQVLGSAVSWPAPGNRRVRVVTPRALVSDEMLTQVGAKHL